MIREGEPIVKDGAVVTHEHLAAEYKKGREQRRARKGRPVGYVNPVKVRSRPRSMLGVLILSMIATVAAFSTMLVIEHRDNGALSKTAEEMEFRKIELRNFETELNARMQQLDEREHRLREQNNLQLKTFFEQYCSVEGTNVVCDPGKKRGHRK